MAGTIQQRVELGRAIAQMYIAAQGVNIAASDAACEAIDDADNWTKFGFNQVIGQSPYNVQAQTSAHFSE